MAGVSKLIDESLYERAKDALKLTFKSKDVSHKLQAIKSAKEHGISKVADVFDVTRKTLMSWINRFASYGIDGLKMQEGRGRKTKLSSSELEHIKTIIENNPNITIKVLGMQISELFDKKLSVGAIHNLLTKLKFSYITPRPSHYKQDKSLAAEFKKKSTR